jgi:hypothetical protein
MKPTAGRQKAGRGATATRGDREATPHSAAGHAWGAVKLDEVDDEAGERPARAEVIPRREGAPRARRSTGGGRSQRAR